MNYVPQSSKKTHGIANVGLPGALPCRWQALFAAFIFVFIFNVASPLAFAQAAKPQTSVQPQTQTPPQVKQPDSLTAAEFSRLVRELSEEGGYFRSDNFTSNETSYLHVV